MKALVTGISGFVGGHLATLLSAKNIEVAGTTRNRRKNEHIAHLGSRIRVVECELRDPFSVERLIGQEKPELIFHLAAESFVPSSWKTPVETIHNNIAGQVHIFEAIRRMALDCKTLIVGSSEQYGMAEPYEIPITEMNPLRPLNPYAVSKIAQDFLGYQYFRNYGLPIVRMRTFNHIGPGQSDHFVTSSFAKQIADIEKGKQAPIIHVGNLKAKRDFTDVRDVVRGYLLALERGDPGECYNLASGTGSSIEDLLNRLLSLSSVRIEVKQDPSRLRPSDVNIVIGDYSKFHQRTGWKPEIPMEQTLLDILNYWRQQP